ncbi:UrcA family protein [Phenylobacterium sp.]|uniref:UrcA family protein n=1 Tax=Phenylobacterium sp. TaxID=1871053 RepID=UPI0035AF11AE
MLRWLLVAVPLIVAAPAGAEPPRIVSAQVPHADLDLDTDGGARIMLRRIAVAARELCAHVESPLFPRARTDAWRCRRKAVERAVTELGEPRVSRLYAVLRARGGLAELVR